MEQPTTGSVWSERAEIVLEGGGPLRGANEVDIRSETITCMVKQHEDTLFVEAPKCLSLLHVVWYNKCTRPWSAGAFSYADKRAC